mgnify:CR=1 FL=1
MDREQIKQILFSEFMKNYNIDLNTINPDMEFAKLKDIDERLDSIEMITFVSEMEDKIKLGVFSSSENPTTINQLIDHLYNNSNK